MATRPKDPSTIKKPATTKAATTMTASSSQPKSRPSSSQSSGEKQVPNYLKPTISSRHDSPAGPKPALNRRKSFDAKPTVTSRAAAKAVSPALAKSASAKTRASTSKSKPLYAKSAKKGTCESFVKKESSAVADQDDRDDRVVETAPEDDDHGEVKTEVSENEISVVSEELVVKSEDDHELDEEEEEEKVEDHHHEAAEKDGEIAVEESVKEEEEEEVAEEVVVEEKLEIADEAVNGEEAVLKDNNGEGEEAKPEAKKVQSEGQSGKKEAQIAYNDVIEETASKLLEKRKNKVKALVGAFETVIDYESAAKQRESSD